MYPIKYGYYLNEFDPYYNYRATKYIADNGIDAYWKWHDQMSWYPEGRYITYSSSALFTIPLIDFTVRVPITAGSSQPFLHISTAFFYHLTGQYGSLLDYAILMPVVWGSLTVVVVFALVRVLWSTSAGMIAALLLAFSPPLILRGNLGWFKSEPLGVFVGLLAILLLILALRKAPSAKKPIVLLVAGLGGVALGLANASWGGAQYFSIPISMLFVAIPFLRKETAYHPLIAIVFSTVTLIVALLFPRPGLSFVFGLPGIALVAGTTFLVCAHMISKIVSPRKRLRAITLMLALSLLGLALLVALGSFYSSDFRYMRAVNPFSSPNTPLLATVQEHGSPDFVDYFSSYSVLLLFSGLGVLVVIFRFKSETHFFILVLALSSIYVSGTLSRLLVFASISVTLLSSIGLAEIIRTRFSSYQKKQTLFDSSRLPSRPGSDTDKVVGNVFREASQKWPRLKTLSLVSLVFALLIPAALIPDLSWIKQIDLPPSIVAATSPEESPQLAWVDALEWISNNTPNNAVVAAWWDYGYWITALGNRTTLADNATLNQTRITRMAQMLMSETKDGLEIARELGADYIAAYAVSYPITIDGKTHLVLGFGGDESKLFSIARNAGINPQLLLEQDEFTPKSSFWNNTLLGQLLPFKHEGYTHLDDDGNPLGITKRYEPGSYAVYTSRQAGIEQEFDEGLTLEYVSDGFGDATNSERKYTVLIYRIGAIDG